MRSNASMLDIVYINIDRRERTCANHDRSKAGGQNVQKELMHE